MTPATPKKRTFSVQMDADVVDLLDKIAKANDRSRNNMLTQMVRGWESLTAINPVNATASEVAAVGSQTNRPAGSGSRGPLSAAAQEKEVAKTNERFAEYIANGNRAGNEGHYLVMLYEDQPVMFRWELVVGPEKRVGDYTPPPSMEWGYSAYGPDGCRKWTAYDADLDKQTSYATNSWLNKQHRSELFTEDQFDEAAAYYGELADV